MMCRIFNFFTYDTLYIYNFTCIFNQHENVIFHHIDINVYMREIEMKIEFNLISVWS